MAFLRPVGRIEIPEDVAFSIIPSANPRRGSRIRSAISSGGDLEGALGTSPASLRQLERSSANRLPCRE